MAATERVKVILCGLPGSGKSFLSTLIKDNVINGRLLDEKEQIECLIVCYDDWMPEVKLDKITKFTGSSEWNHTRKSVRHLVEQLIAEVRGHPWQDLDHLTLKQVKDFRKKLQNCESSRKQNVIFIIDDNMNLKSMRFEYFQLARKYNIGYCQVYVKCEPSIALIRNSSRVARVPDPVIQTMAERFEAPQPQKNSWERLSMVIDNDSNSFASCWHDLESLLRDAFEKPVHPLDNDEGAKSLSRELCLTSVLHQADQVLRKLLSEAMQNHADKPSVEDLKQFSLRLNAARQHVLTAIKAGEISIPTDIFAEVESGNVPKILPQFKLFLKEEMNKSL